MGKAVSAGSAVIAEIVVLAVIAVI